MRRRPNCERRWTSTRANVSGLAWTLRRRSRPQLNSSSSLPIDGQSVTMAHAGAWCDVSRISLSTSTTRTTFGSSLLRIAEEDQDTGPDAPEGGHPRADHGADSLVATTWAAPVIRLYSGGLSGMDERISSSWCAGHVSRGIHGRRGFGEEWESWVGKSRLNWGGACVRMAVP